MNVAGRQVHQPVPNITYQTAVEQVETPPTEILRENETLNRTVKVDEESYMANYNILDVFQEMEVNHSKYGYVLDILDPLLILHPFLILHPWEAFLSFTLLLVSHTCPRFED